MVPILRIGAFLLTTVLVLALDSTPAGGADVAQLYRQSYQAEAQGKPAVALQAIRQVEAQVGGSYFVHARSGWLAYLAGRHAEAVTAYEKAIAAAPGAIEPRLGLTAPLLALKQWRKLEALHSEYRMGRRGRRGGPPRLPRPPRP